MTSRGELWAVCLYISNTIIFYLKEKGVPAYAIYEADRNSTFGTGN